MRNIVLLISDQWRWDTIFSPGHPCKTPHLAGFAADASAFPRAYTTCPLCSPARGSLFTGLWPHQTGLMDNVSGSMFYPHGKLHPSRRTYLERLRDDAGYAISYAGKWHLGSDTLRERGMPDVAESDGMVQRGEGCHRRKLGLDRESPFLVPYYASYRDGADANRRIAEAGIDQLGRLARESRPFCSVISLPGPHFPHTAPQRFVEIYGDLPTNLSPPNYSMPWGENSRPVAQSRPFWPCQNTLPLSAEDWRLTCQHYWAYCTYLDGLVGDVLQEIQNLGLWEDSVIGFTADHGEMLGAHGMFDKGPYLYQEATHIPMVVRDPLGRHPAGLAGFVSLRDLFPTVLSLAGCEGVLAPKERERSFWHGLNDVSFCTYDAYQGREFKIRGIHTGHLKYNWSPHDICELYDLQADPGERTNLIESPEHQSIVKELHGQLSAWMRSEGDYLLSSHHLLPVGSYVDGRGFAEQHDHGWSAEDWRWFTEGWTDDWQLAH